MVAIFEPLSDLLRIEGKIDSRRSSFQVCLPDDQRCRVCQDDEQYQLPSTHAVGTPCSGALRSISILLTVFVLSSQPSR